MNSYLSGLFVPAISGQVTYLGFPFETLDLERKNAESQAFYRAASASALRTRAAELGLDYVLWGTYERGLGGTDPGVVAGWSLVASAGQARLYRVDATATALR
jgi:hypothetical protein